MNIIGRAYHWITGKSFGGGSIANNGFILSGAVGATTDLPDWLRNELTPSQYRELIMRYVSWAYSCANGNANVMAMNRPGLYRKVAKKSTKAANVVDRATKAYLVKARPDLLVNESDEVERIESHSLLDLIAMPNPEMGCIALLEETALDLELTGNAWWSVVDVGTSEANGTAFELWLLDPTQVSAIADKSRKRNVASWTYGTGPGAIELSIEDVGHFKFANPRDPVYGFAPMRAALGAIDLDIMVDLHEVYTYRNRARPDLFIKCAPGVQKVEVDRIKDEWNKLYRGPRKAGSVGVGAMLDVVPLSQNAKDMMLPERLKWDREIIASCFGRPLSMLTFEGANRASADAGLYQYSKYTLLPRLVKRDGVMNHWLVPRVAPGEEVFFASANPVMEDADLRLKEEDQDVRNRVRTPNEIRSARGLPPLEGGDSFPEPVAPQFPPPTTRSVKSAPDYDNKRLNNIVAKVFKDQISETISKVRASKRVKDESGPDPKVWLFNRATWDRVLAEQSYDVLAGVFTVSGGQAAQGFGVSFDVTNERAVRLLKSTIDKYARRVNGESHKRLLALFEQAIADGMTMDELAARLRVLQQQWTDGLDGQESRAEVVARTETARAVSAGTDAGYAEAGIEQKEWNAAGDGCEFCRAMQGRRVSVGSAFLDQGSKLDGVHGGSMDVDYADVDGPPVHPNCRCTLLPVVE